ncbi:DsbA family protein [Streptomyces sp. NPDC055721]|uniref:DsbA family protein n=1 Tax=Streptomyces sp. NPDC127132 TaxID=3345374 RepID=UPI0036390C50
MSFPFLSPSSGCVGGTLPGALGLWIRVLWRRFPGGARPRFGGVDRARSPCRIRAASVRISLLRKGFPMVVRRTEYVVASFLDARTGGTASARAANALRAAVDAGQGKFAQFQAALFASQPAGESGDGYSVDHLLRIADQVEGLRGAAFDRAVREDTYKEWVADAEKALEDSGVGGTPTVLVDGTALPGGDALYDAAAFSKALRDAGV